MRFFTFKRQVRLVPGQIVRFVKGRGYYAYGRPRVQPITMYDAVTVANIPAYAAAVAGYVNGHWPTFSTLETAFPHAYRLSIDVIGIAKADVLDIETGDATNRVAPRWYRRQKAAGAKSPVFYTSVSNAQALVETLASFGIARTGYRLWTAHYTGKPHRCTAACGFGFVDEADATQYTNRALGRTLDASLCKPGFFA